MHNTWNTNDDTTFIAPTRCLESRKRSTDILKHSVHSPPYAIYENISVPDLRLLDVPRAGRRYAVLVLNDNPHYHADERDELATRELTRRSFGCYLTNKGQYTY